MNDDTLTFLCILAAIVGGVLGHIYLGGLSFAIPVGGAAIGFVAGAAAMFVAAVVWVCFFDNSH